MKKVVHKDKKGRLFYVNIPDDAPESHASMGIPIGPPDLSDLGLPIATEVRLNNELFNRGLLIRKDVKSRPIEVFAALQSAFRVDAAAITNLYEG